MSTYQDENGLADALGITRAALNNIKNCHRDARGETAISIGKITATPTDLWIFGARSDQLETIKTKRRSAIESVMAKDQEPTQAA